MFFLFLKLLNQIIKKKLQFHLNFIFVQFPIVYFFFFKENIKYKNINS